MAGLQEYKCPCCGGAIAFDSKIQKMKCPYCDTEFEMDELKGYDAELQNEQADDMEWDTSAGSEWQEGETDGLRTYVCKSCGGEIVGDANMAATSCPFCDNPIVMMGQFAGALKPDLVIPFKLDKKAAKEGLKKHLTGKRLLPKIFKDQNHIDEIKGVYVPFWLYDFDAETEMTAKAEKIRTERHGDTEYTYTDHFHVYRDVEAQFEKVPADASEKMDDDTMDKLEPFDYTALKPFAMPYLSGYLSERYNFTDEQMQSRVRKRVDRYITEIARSTMLGYSTVSVLDNHISMNNKHNEYALLPVWMLNCRYHGKDFNFVLNGQTGKIVADRPISKGKAAAYFVGIFVIMMIVLTLGGLAL